MSNRSDVAAELASLLRRFVTGAGCGLTEARNKRLRVLGNQEDGGPLVEMALILPLLMTILTGSVSFCIALYSYQQLGNVTASAAHQLGASAGGVNGGDPCAVVATTVTTALPAWTAAKFTYTVIITDASGTAHTYGPTAGSSFSCAAGAGNMSTSPPEPVSVQVSYQYSWMPILSFSPSSPLTSTQTAMVE